MFKSDERPTKKNRRCVAEALDVYFRNCETMGIDPTYSGVAYAAGYQSRVEALEKSHDKTPLGKLLARAFLYCEQCAEEALYRKGIGASVLAALKNNAGWSDQRSIGIDVVVSQAQIDQKTNQLIALRELRQRQGDEHPIALGEGHRMNALAIDNVTQKAVEAEAIQEENENAD